MATPFSAAASGPLVSVIIPNYNHANYLPQRIESVLNQTYSNLEILILDDCSPDNSREVIADYARKDARIRTVFNQENSGSTFKQWNKGIELTKGKYIWIAESDDYACPDLLAKLVAKLEVDEAIGLAYCDSWHVYEARQRVERNPEYYTRMDDSLWTHDFVLDGHALITRFMSYANIIPNASAVVLRRAVLARVAPPDGSWQLVGDWLYWASIMAVSKVAFVAEPLNYFRFHGNNVRSSKITNGLALLEFVRALKPLREYGPPEPSLYRRKLTEHVSFWIHCMVHPDYHIPVSRHRQLFRAFAAIEPHFTNRLSRAVLSFLFSNKLSGIRQVIGDNLLYPLLKKIRA